MKEIWKDVVGYEGLYQVSNLGRVKSLITRKILRQAPDKNGYLRVFLYKNKKRKTCMMERLVAMAFLPNPNNLPQVNHKDENKGNNNVSNLEWCTVIYNCNYGNRNNKISKPVICVETGITYKSLLEAGNQLNIQTRHIGDCCKGKRKTTGGYHWKYTDTR